MDKLRTARARAACSIALEGLTFMRAIGVMCSIGLCPAQCRALAVGRLSVLCQSSLFFNCCFFREPTRVHGRLAQHNAAPEISVAAFIGKSDQSASKRSAWDIVRTFFKANPTTD